MEKMQELMQEIMLVVTILIPIITGVTSLIKTFVYGTEENKVKPLMPERFKALIPVVVGFLLGWAYTPFSDLSILLLLWAGGLAGLAAGGFYSVQNIRNK